MGNLRVDLKKQQLKTNYKTEAENCMIILEKLKEIDGAVWNSKWNVLTDCIGTEGVYPNSFMMYKPSVIGYLFLRGIEASRKFQTSLATDLGLEIVLGCDRFDRNDFRELVKENSINAKELREQTKEYIKKTFAKDDKGNEPAPDDFVEEQLNFWFEGLL